MAGGDAAEDPPGGRGTGPDRLRRGGPAPTGFPGGGGAGAVRPLAVALALQVGVNFANDYSDGVRGSDEVRVGPVRLVAAGLAPPRQGGAAAARVRVARARVRL